MPLGSDATKEVSRLRYAMQRLLPWDQIEDSYAWGGLENFLLAGMAMAWKMVDAIEVDVL